MKIISIYRENKSLSFSMELFYAKFSCNWEWSHTTYHKSESILRAENSAFYELWPECTDFLEYESKIVITTMYAVNKYWKRLVSRNILQTR